MYGLYGRVDLQKSNLYKDILVMKSLAHSEFAHLSHTHGQFNTSINT